MELEEDYGIRYVPCPLIGLCLIPLCSGTTLLAQLRKATVMSRKQKQNHEEFTATLPLPVVEKWQKMVDDWNADRRAPNPYIEPVVGECDVLTFGIVI